MLGILRSHVPNQSGDGKRDDNQLDGRNQRSDPIYQMLRGRIKDMFPYWGKDAVNADLRNVHQNPTYRKLVDKQRCVIPCNGFCYWRQEGLPSTRWLFALLKMNVVTLCLLLSENRGKVGKQYLL